MEESTIMALLSLSIVLAFGIELGFDAIYKQDFITKFKLFRKELMSNLRKRLIYIALKSNTDNNKYEKEINDFFESWQDYQEIKTAYDNIVKYRRFIFYLFLVSGFLYFLSLHQVILFDKPIITYSHVVFAIGLLVIFVFGKELINLKKKMSEYELSKPLFEESVQRIINKVTKK